MYYLEKCARCTRHGSVAEKETDKICKLCKEKQNVKQPKSEEEEE